MERILPLTSEQISLVEENISVIDTVIFSRIIYDNNSYGLEYDDIFQEGALLLCKAAMKYDNQKNCSFKAFAYIVIWNGLISYCKKINKKKKDYIKYTEGLKATDITLSYDAFQKEKIIEIEVLLFLENLKKQYSGTVALGIEALIWKVKGLTGSEIADKYNVKPNLVGAWISRALKKLRQNSVFNLYTEDFQNRKAS